VEAKNSLQMSHDAHRHTGQFLQRVSIACYAKRCTSYLKSARPSVCLSVCPSHAGTVSKQLYDSPMTSFLVTRKRGKIWRKLL